MADLLKDIGSYLISKGIYTGLAKDVFIDSRPDLPDKACCIFEYQGSPTTPLSGESLERRVQILTRDSSSAAAKSKAWEIFNLLDKADDPEDVIDLSETRYGIFSALQPPFKLEIDGKQRSVYVCNYSVISTRD
ncbi:MAG: minor capsid protein [Bacillota bacterium]|nr:minor capsid protein [Bacillota bacterium]